MEQHSGGQKERQPLFGCKERGLLLPTGHSPGTVVALSLTEEARLIATFFDLSLCLHLLHVRIL